MVKANAVGGSRREEEMQNQRGRGPENKRCGGVRCGEDEARRGSGAQRMRCGEEEVLSKMGDNKEKRRRKAVFLEVHSRCVPAGGACE